MDSNVTEEQRMLLDTAARFIEDVCPVDVVRDDVFADSERLRDYRRRSAELGWYSMLVPEALGGGSASDNGLLDAALIAYVRGASLQPGAFVSTNVAAYALADSGTEQQRTEVLPCLVSGEDSAALVVGAPILPDEVGGTGTHATSVDDGYELTGEATLVQDASTSSWLLVAATTSGGVSLFLIPTSTDGVSIATMDSLDVTRRFAAVTFDRAVVAGSSLVGEAGDVAELVDRLLAVASVLTAAESVGAMDRDFGTALQYSKDRIAFGRPIGSFQGVKHQLADTSLALEMSKAITLAAANLLGSGDPYGVQAACMAKAFVGDNGIELAQTCFQVFGGIGFTWDHDQHLYLRRITTDAALFGGADWYRERLCQLSGISTRSGT